MENNRSMIAEPSIFSEALLNARNQLTEDQVFFEAVLNDPEKLFRDGHRHFNLQNVSMQILNSYYYMDKDRVRVHEFQELLAVITNNFIQDWARRHALTGTVEVRVRNNRTYPSIFAIYHDDTEFIQFSIVEKFYGIRTKAKGPDVLRSEYAQVRSRIEQDVEPLLAQKHDIEKKIQDIHWYIRNHYRTRILEQSRRKRSTHLFNKQEVKKVYSRGTICRLHILQIKEHFIAIVKAKKVAEMNTEKIRSISEQIDILRKSGQRYMERYGDIDQIIQRHQKISELTSQMIPLFEQYDYRLQEERSFLY